MRDYRTRTAAPDGFRARPAAERVFDDACTLWALMIAGINPGKRLLISSQRDTLCISTPRRSPRIKPASRSALKCWDSVDLGMSFSLTRRKLEHTCGQSEAAISM